jgi:hypothetical protein
MTPADNSKNSRMITETSRLAETLCTYTTRIFSQDQSFRDHSGTAQITAGNNLVRVAGLPAEGRT